MILKQRSINKVKFKIHTKIVKIQKQLILKVKYQKIK